MQSAKQLARIGIFYLEETILDVILEAKQKGNSFVQRNNRWVVIYLQYEVYNVK